MELFIGMDEAGYGPNLGPLVITASVWSVPGNAADCDIWSLLGDVVAQTPSPTNGKLHVADSKQVYRSTGGIENLETAALCVLSLAGIEASSFHELWQLVAVTAQTDDDQEPWFAEPDFALPVACDADRLHRQARALRECAERAGVCCRLIRSDIVLTRRFNRMTTSERSKGLALSRLSLRLLRDVWDPDADGRALIVADKHGGRNRYDGLLCEVLDDRMVFRLNEGREKSEYRVGDTRIRFQTRAESHLPVAVASIVSKYLRELAMRAFNAFWQRQVQGLRPTAGYPVDARRFKAEIAERQMALSISDDVLWRQR